MSTAGALVPEPSPRDPRDLTADPERMDAENRAVEEAELAEMADDLPCADCCPDCHGDHGDCWRCT